MVTKFDLVARDIERASKRIRLLRHVLTMIARGNQETGKPYSAEVSRQMARYCLEQCKMDWTKETEDGK